MQKLDLDFSQPVRIAALRYLGVLPSIVRYNILHPQKSYVIRELGKVLDDPKRAVRKEAVDARFVVFHLLSPSLTCLCVDQAGNV